MKSALIAITAASLASVLSWHIANRNATEILQKRYYNELQKTFQFESGYTFKLKHITLRPYEGSYYVQILGESSDAEVPMSVDLRVREGSIISRDNDRVPYAAHLRVYESEIVYLSDQERLQMHVTINPQDAASRETIIKEVPNPIHHHRLIEMQIGTNPSTAVGKARIIKT